MIYYPTYMIRKSHSWSLTWTRDKSADQNGPSIVSLWGGQLVPQAFSSDFALRTLYGTSYLSRHGGQSVPQACQSKSRYRQADRANAGYYFALQTSDFVLIPRLPLLGGEGRGEGERSLRLLHPAPCRVFRIRVHPSSSPVPISTQISDRASFNIRS